MLRKLVIFLSATACIERCACAYTNTSALVTHSADDLPRYRNSTSQLITSSLIKSQGENSTTPSTLVATTDTISRNSSVSSDRVAFSTSSSNAQNVTTRPTLSISRTISIGIANQTSYILHLNSSVASTVSRSLTQAADRSSTSYTGLPSITTENSTHGVATSETVSNSSSRNSGDFVNPYLPSSKFTRTLNVNSIQHATSASTAHPLITAKPPFASNNTNGSNLCPQATSSYWNITITPSTNGTGPEYASLCNSILISWTSASATWSGSIWDRLRIPNQDVFPSSVLKITNTGQEWTGTASQPYTTLCDGYPRAHGTWTPLSKTVYTATATQTGFAELVEAPDPMVSECRQRYGNADLTYPIPKPSCSVNPVDCAGLWATFLSKNPTWTAPMGNPSLPVCSTTGSAFASAYTDPNENACQITGNNVRLYYWPPESTRKNPCETDTTASITAPPPIMTRKATVGAVTITSPDIFLEIDSLAALWHNPFPDSFGKTLNATANFSNIQVTVPPEQLSTLIETLPGVPLSQIISRKYHLTDKADYEPSLTAEPYNFQDLEGPVPARAYFLASKIQYANLTQSLAILPSSSLTTIFDDYSPFLSMPTQIRTLDSRLVTCSLAIRGLYDPPQPLSEAASFAPVTPTNKPIQPPAQHTAPAPGNAPPALPTMSQVTSAAAEIVSEAPFTRVTPLAPIGVPPAATANPPPLPPAKQSGAIDDNPAANIVPPPARASGPSPGQPAPPVAAGGSSNGNSLPPANPLPPPGTPSASGNPPAPNQGTAAPVLNGSPGSEQNPSGGNPAANQPPAPPAINPKLSQLVNNPPLSPAQNAADGSLTNLPVQPLPGTNVGSLPGISNVNPPGDGSQLPPPGNQPNIPQEANQAQAPPASPLENGPSGSFSPDVGGQLFGSSSQQQPAPNPSPPSQNSNVNPLSQAIAAWASNAAASAVEGNINAVVPGAIASTLPAGGSPHDAGPNPVVPGVGINVPQGASGASGPQLSTVPAPGTPEGHDEVPNPDILPISGTQASPGPSESNGQALPGNSSPTVEVPESISSPKNTPLPAANPPSQTVHLNLGSTTMAVPVPAGASILAPGSATPNTLGLNGGGSVPGAPISPSLLPANDATLVPGGAPLIVGTHTLSLAPGGPINMDGTFTNPPDISPSSSGQQSTLAITNVDAVNSALMNLAPDSRPTVIGAHTVNRAPDGSFEVDGTATIAPNAIGTALVNSSPNFPQLGDIESKLEPGSPATIIDGHTITHGSQGFIIDGTATVSSAAALGTALAAASNADSLVNVAASLRPGGLATSIDGHIVTLAPNGNYVVDGTATFTSAGALTSALITPAPNSGAIKGALASVQVGAPATTIDGHTISRAPGGSYIVDGTATYAAPQNVASAIASSEGGNVLSSALSGLQQGGSATTVDGHTITRASQGFIVDGSSTFSNAAAAATAVGQASSDTQLAAAISSLAPGSPATTVDGHKISHGSDGLYVVDGTSAFPDAAAAATAIGQENAEAEIKSEVSSLKPGSATTIDGHTISRATDSAFVIDGTKTLQNPRAIATAICESSTHTGTTKTTRSYSDLYNLGGATGSIAASKTLVESTKALATAATTATGKKSDALSLKMENSHLWTIMSFLTSMMIGLWIW